MRAVVYARISQDRAGAGVGVGQQEADGRDLAASLGAQVVGVYVDNDSSAYHLRKPRRGYQRMVADLAAGHAEMVICWHTERLHRHPRELEDYIDLCETRQIITRTVVAGEFDLATPSGRMVARILGARDRMESEHKSQRTARRMRQLAETGRPGGGPRAFGYQPNRAGIVQAEAAQVQWMAEQVLAGASLNWIAHDLNRRGVTTARGLAWQDTSVRAVFRSPRLAGLATHYGQITVEATWPPILPRSTWEAVNAVLTARTPIGRRPPRRHVLSGEVQCGREGCGQRLYAGAVDRRGLLRLVCRYRPTGAGCGQSMYYLPVLGHVGGYVVGRLEDEAVFAGLAAASDTGQAADIARQVATDEARLAGLAEAFADSADAPRAFRRAVELLEERIAANRQTLGGLRRHVPAGVTPATVRRVWEDPDGDVGVKQALMRLACASIVISPGRKGRKLDMSRIVISPQ